MIADGQNCPPYPPPTNPARPCLSWAGKAEGAARVFSGLTDGISRGIESAGAGLSETLFDSTLRLGVTGLSRAGKTVFITALVANLLNRGRMPQLQAQAQGRIQ
ncbi:MAG: YcjX family protein, partial [Tabrizicola sp.]|nr:YcjX family protein [Tabrizicola sp.]